ncbi:MAG: hypothetical protein ABIH72_03620 [archaeon]
MKFNFRKVASVVASVVMLGSTVGIAAAASYPAPFVSGGGADVAIVHGATAAITDLSAAVDVGQNLQFHLASQTAQGGSTASGVVASGGDSIRLDRSSDRLNMGDSVADVFVTTVSDEHLPVLLADGTYTNDDNTDYKYTQRIKLGLNLNLSFFSDDDYKVDTPTVGMKIASGRHILNYTLDFITNAQTTSVTTTHLDDFETTDIEMFGKSYYILTALNNSNIKLTFLDSANTAQLTEGETISVTAGSKTYNDVQIVFISSTEVKLSVDGESTNSMAEGGTYKLKDGSYVGIKDIMYNAKDTGISSVEFSIGAGKLILENGQKVELNDDDIQDLTAYIDRGSTSGGAQTIDKIVIVWTLDEEEFIAADTDLTMPGFEAVKFTMGEFFIPAAEEVSIKAGANDYLQLRAPIKSGDATIDLLYANSTGDFGGIGKDSSNKLVTSSANSILFNITNNDEQFVVSWNSTTEGESHLLSATVTTKDNANKTTIKDQVTGQNICTDLSASDTCDVGNVVLTVNSIEKLGDSKWVNVSVGGGGSFHQLYTAGGLVIWLPFTQANSSCGYGAINTSDTNKGAWLSTAACGFNTYTLRLQEEDKDGNIAKGDLINVTFDDTTDNKVYVSNVQAEWSGGNTFEDDDTDNHMGHVISDLSTLAEWDKSGDQYKLTLTYAGSQSYADVFLASPSASLSGGTSGSTGGSVSELGSVTVSDSEVSQVSGKNLIVIGGSCVNAAAAKMLGSESAICGEAWTTETGVASGEFLIEVAASPYNADKVAMLVAGFEAADTQNAAKYVTTQTVTTDEGTKYKGTSATSADLVTSEA